MGSYYYSSASVKSDGSIVCAKSGYVHMFWWSDGTSSIKPSTWRKVEDKVKDSTQEKAWLFHGIY
jgi:hypothetical protein